MLSPDRLADLTIIVAVADFLADEHATVSAKRLLADEFVALIRRSVLTMDLRHDIHDGATYVAVTMNRELHTVSIDELDLPADLKVDWPA